jgi:arylformamidase
MKLYRDFATVEELDRQYLPGLRVPNAGEIRAGWAIQNARVGKTLHSRLAYGPTVDEYVDVFRGPAGAPIHVFLHGGYWRANAPGDFHFVVERLVADGFCVVVPNYSLCPKVTIDEIVRQVRACLKWLHAFADLAGADPANLTLSGHSAGGHLTAMALLTDWPGEYGIDPGFIRGGIAVSGLYDLAPFPYTTLQPSLQLTWDQVARNSPIKSARAPCAPLVLAVGGDESEEFQRQMNDYARHVGAEAFAVPGANHFTVLDAYLDPASRLYREIARLAGRG